MKNKYLLLMVFSVFTLTTDAQLSPAGKNANFHMQVCSPDGLLVCLTGISNYVVGNKQYDVIFKYGYFREIIDELEELSVSDDCTYYDNGPGSLITDASQYMSTFNRDYIDYDPVTDTFASDIKAVFASSDFVYKSESPTLYTNIRWGEYWPGFIAWRVAEYNDWHTIQVEKGRSIKYFYGTDVIFWGSNPEQIEVGDRFDFYMIARVSDSEECYD